MESDPLQTPDLSLDERKFREEATCNSRAPDLKKACLFLLFSLFANPSFAARTNTSSFTISAPAITVTAGQSTTATVQVTESGGSFSVSLSVSGMPAGVTATLQPATTSSTSTLTVTAAASAAAGSYKLTLQGTAPGIANQSTAVMLTVQAPAPTITSVTLTCSPASILTTQTSSCIPTVTGTGSFNNQVNMTASAGKLTPTKVSSGTSVTFTPPGVGSAVITAASVQDATRSASATVVAGIPTLAFSTTSIAFGSVTLNTFITQPLMLSSTGTAAVTVSAASISGAGFQLSGLTVPLTLSPGQTATLYVVFDPTTAGAVTGKLSLTSNSSTGSTAAVSLTGTGQLVTYQVNLSWNAPASSPDPVAGYVVYRAPSGTTSYQELSATVTGTNWVDGNVQNGTAYDYYVVSVDASGMTSNPSNIFTAAIPQ